MISLEQVGRIEWHATMVLGVKKGKGQILPLYRDHGKTQFHKDGRIQLGRISLGYQPTGIA